MEGILSRIGRLGIGFVRALWSFARFFANALYHCLTPPFYGKELLKQLAEIGFYSLPVVALTSLFAGMVLAVQSYNGFGQFSAHGAVATVLAISIVRELGPVFAGLMVAGRIGATMAASIGTMRVSEQIDALATLQTNPFKYIIAPRLSAAVLAMPFLVFIANIVGIFGGFMVSTTSLGFNPYSFIKSVYDAISMHDIWVGVVKAAAFGAIISSLGCYFGYNTKGGAEGVGRATTSAVVVSSIFILIANYFITSMFFEGL